MIVSCWSGPRNISTALMRSWSSRKDTFVSDEPFYAYYLKETKLKHPLYKEIINKYSSNYDEVVNYLINRVPKGKKIWYQKHMAHHIFDFNNIEWVNNCENCILLRHPREVISSYSKKNKLNSVQELGYPQQYEIIKYLKKINKSYLIIDSSELLKNPEKVLSNWCMKINIKFDKSMLTWKKGNYVSDGIWWKSWYDNVVKTTGFKEYKKKDINIENKYDSIYNESMKYYSYLKEAK
tara:strand:- start:12379 stop:13089 length:711 start_codon:yes stop_codon:yes gene_type:complete